MIHKEACLLEGDTCLAHRRPGLDSWPHKTQSTSWHVTLFATPLPKTTLKSNFCVPPTMIFLKIAFRLWQCAYVLGLFCNIDVIFSSIQVCSKKSSCLHVNSKFFFIKMLSWARKGFKWKMESLTHARFGVWSPPRHGTRILSAVTLTPDKKRSEYCQKEVKRDHHLLLVGLLSGPALMETWRHLTKLKTEKPRKPVISPPAHLLPKKHRNTVASSTRVFEHLCSSVPLVTIVKVWKQPKHPTTD